MVVGVNRHAGRSFRAENRQLAEVFHQAAVFVIDAKIAVTGKQVYFVQRGVRDQFVDEKRRVDGEDFLLGEGVVYAQGVVVAHEEIGGLVATGGDGACWAGWPGRAFDAPGIDPVAAGVGNIEITGDNPGVARVTRWMRGDEFLIGVEGAQDIDACAGGSGGRNPIPAPTPKKIYGPLSGPVFISTNSMI